VVPQQSEGPCKADWGAGHPSAYYKGCRPPLCVLQLVGFNAPLRALAELTSPVEACLIALPATALQQLQGPSREQERCRCCHKHSFTRSPNPADPFLMSAAFVGSAVISSTGGSGAAAAVLNPLCVLGAVGLGVSLVQIHIYVDPLKKALQVRRYGVA
jgi:hypothetical protein